MLFAIILYLLHAALFGYAARRVTEYRNQPDGFWWGFWLGGIGLLVVIFRNDGQNEIRTAPPGSSINVRPGRAYTSYIIGNPWSNIYQVFTLED